MFSSKSMLILSVVAMVCFLALIGLQMSELSYYGADPSIWPPKP